MHEEYGPELRYIQANKNIVADALLRINMKMKNLVQILTNIDRLETPKFKGKLINNFSIYIKWLIQE